MILLKSIMCFFGFNCLASGLYIVNDLLDLESDRHHAKKKFRPFASGALSLETRILMSGMLLSISTYGLAFISLLFMALLVLLLRVEE